ncbi:MAG TPA: MucB/RseB C-terminal domain-containing protein [Burkholderiales bacterium]|jgi:sigma-E factor negative regulatory protein RseB|nr:MucB/RseB C-terminal domain-containing protein [Burkholderiales bacterium]
MRLPLYTAVVCLGLAAAAGAADTLEQDEALAILQRIADAARKLDYVGTFVYQHSDRFETSRIVHYVDTTGEYEKLETLDGPRREVIRNNDEVLCYYPDAKIVRSEKRVARRTFPALLPDQLSLLTEFYRIKKGVPERIAGHDSQALVLEPKDGLRYGHKLWADAHTGLLLKARMIDERNRVVEQFSFTQVEIGSGVTREMVAPSFNVRLPEWRFDRFAHNMVSGAESGWTVKQYPAGFRKIMELRRSKQGSTVPITHLVYSDGLAAVSVFIEPLATRSKVHEGLSRQGAINIYTRTIDDQVVTVLGEAPASTVMLIANSVSFQGR